MKADWFSIGNNLLLFAIGVLTAWNVWRSQRNTSTLNKVHVLVNHQMELQKKALAEVTAAKALLTNDPSDRAAADLALADYKQQVKKQATIE